MESLREQILNSDDLEERVVEVPEWKTTVVVRGMTAKEAAEYRTATVTGPGGFSLAKALSLVVCMTARHALPPNGDGKVHGGNLIFEAADRERLSLKGAAAVERLAAVAIDLSGGLGTNNAVEEAEKNSSATPAAG